MIERFNNFHTFDFHIPVSLFGSINQIVTICAILANFKQPIIAQKLRVKENKLPGEFPVIYAGKMFTLILAENFWVLFTYIYMAI